MLVSCFCGFLGIIADLLCLCGVLGVFIVHTQINKTEQRDAVILMT